MVNEWRNHEFELVIFALGAGLGAGFLAVTILHLNFLLGIMVFFVVFFLIFDRATPQQKSLAKLYQASVSDSHQVVQNILIEKGIPYRKNGSDCFLLDHDGIEIRLKRAQQRSGGTWGTIVTLVPKEPDGWELILSLRHKLDDAFRPRGLSTF